MAVDSAGNVYVTDNGNDQVWKLAAGADKLTALPLTGLKDPDGVAVDAAGNVYVADYSQQPGAQARPGGEHRDRAAVRHAAWPRRSGGGRREQRLRRRQPSTIGC